jgi:hypothetical protein
MNKTRLILLCEVAIGKTGSFKGHDYFRKTGKNLDDGIHSALGFS